MLNVVSCTSTVYISNNEHDTTLYTCKLRRVLLDKNWGTFQKSQGQHLLFCFLPETEIPVFMAFVHIRSNTEGGHCTVVTSHSSSMLPVCVCLSR